MELIMSVLAVLLLFGFFALVFLASSNFKGVEQERHDRDEEEHRIWELQNGLYTLSFDDGSEELVTWERLVEEAPEEAQKFWDEA